jgi:hypothetical protein
LTFATIASDRIVPKYHELLENKSSTQNVTSFDELVTELDASLAQAMGDTVQNGIQHLLEAVILVRERRVEETPLTLDLRLPLSCSWDLVQEAASSAEGGTLRQENLAAKLPALRALADASTDRLVEELVGIGMHLGRGISQLVLRDVAPASRTKGHFRCEWIWTDHEHAPLSQLYTLDWRLPPATGKPEVRIVLLPNSTVAVHVQSDPFFEYLLGDWRYVDIVTKTKAIASAVERDPAAADFLAPSLYRVARMAHQLASHNHGAIIELDLSEQAMANKHMQYVKQVWDVKEIDDKGLPLSGVSSKASGEAPEFGPTGYGRLAYALCIRDGISILSLGDDFVSLRLNEFGWIEDIEKDKISAAWKQRAQDLGIDEDTLGGGRHHAAFQRAIAKATDRVILCVSQDGNVNVFVAGDALRLR